MRKKYRIRVVGYSLKGAFTVLPYLGFKKGMWPHASGSFYHGHPALMVSFGWGCWFAGCAFVLTGITRARKDLL